MIIGFLLYVNGQYKGDNELGWLMHDFLCNDPDDMHYDLLAERSRYFKENPKGVSEMCKVMEDMRKEALEQGRILTLIEAVRKLKNKVGFSDQQVKDLLKLSNDDCEPIAAQI